MLSAAAAVLAVPVPAALGDELDDYVREQMQKQHIPGLALTVVQDGRVTREKTWGFANVEHQVPVTPDTVFEIGSITKQITAVAVMMLVEQGRVELDVPISRYLPDLPETWRPVTARQLLTHTSGIPDYEILLGYGAYRNVMTPERIIAATSGRPLDFAPGTQWRYSNTGYNLLSWILEKVSGESCMGFLKNHILDPLGMSHTRSSEPMDIIPHRAAGYAWKDGRLENRDPMQPIFTTGAGMLVSTTGDMVKWDAELRAQTLLKKETYALMWRDAPLADGTPCGYGFGWFVSPMHGRRSLEHSGGTTGFTTGMRCLPDDRVTVIVLTNAYQDTAAPGRIINNVLQRLKPELVYQPIPDTEPEVTAKIRDFYARRGDAEPFERDLSEPMAAKMRLFWHHSLPYYHALGTALSVEPVERTERGPQRLHRYRVRYREVSRLVLATLDAEGKILNLQAEEE